MTRQTSARVAGFTFLFYIGVAFPSLLLFNRATQAEGIAAQLARIAEHAADVRLAILLSVLSCFSALILGLALYGLTREEDHELAMLALCCRVGEGVLGGIFLIATVGLLWLATGPEAPEAAGAQALGAFLLQIHRWNPTIAALFFAVGSTIFAWLLLRGRMIPVGLAWLGVAGSAILVLTLPFQLAGIVSGLGTQLVWIPVALFELILGPWLLFKGVTLPTRTS